MNVLRRVLLILGIVVVLGVGACYAFWPEGWVVNAPRGAFSGVDPKPASELLERIRVPDGFEIGVWADGIEDARFMRFTSTGDLLISSPRRGTVYLLERDADGDGRSDGRVALIQDLDRPHGLDFLDDWLYVAERTGIQRVRFDAAGRSVEGPLEKLAEFPGGGNHRTRTLRFGPDGYMYVSIGSTCNACVEKDERRATMMRFRPDGSEGEIYATGLRNAVGFDWRPADGGLYATDNGRDMLGDDFPPCELNRVERGAFYGWPFANGDGVPDPDLGEGRDAEIAASVTPVHGFGAHTAPLGITFYRGDLLPPRYRGQAFAALHGSWNRSRKSGYKVVLLEWDASGGIAESDFVWGFELDEDVIGRPVDVAGGPDGALYVSDDYAGAVYRIAPSEG